MCGIIGIAGRGPVNQSLFDGLTVLQHRGQDAAGIVTCDDGRLFLRKDNGLVRDVVRTRHMRDLHGNTGIGHVRYPTAGSSDSAEAQPFYVNSPFGITLAHNGNLTNAAQLKDELFRSDRRHINTNSDSEILLNVFAHELQQRCRLSVDADDIFAAVAAMHRRVRGAYAAVVLIVGFGLVAFRDPHGIRPLVFGRRETEEGMEYMAASESVALDALDFERIRDVTPGEAVLFDLNGRIHTRQCAEHPIYSPCIFEYVYLARPDSIMDQVSVHKARLRMGEYLAEKILRVWPDQDIDVVIPIPDTSRTAALQMASILGLKYREGFIKNRYIARTFIMPGQKIRRKSVRQKLNAIDLEFRGKNVLLVDDSIVRGTTSGEIIRMAREAGARKVYFASAAPPVRYPNVYGIDMPAARELIAHSRTEEEVARAIGADHLIFQDLADLEEAVRRGNPELKRFDASCFTGEYVTGDINRDYLDDLARERADTAKMERRSTDNAIIDLHNQWNRYDDTPEFGFASLAVRAGQVRTHEGEHAEPLFLTSSFVFASAAEAAARFSTGEGNIYSRFTNPTVRMFQDRLAALEGGEACIATGSGMAAILATCMALLGSGDHIVSASGVFGSTISLFNLYLSKFGVATTYVPLADPTAWEAAIRPETRLFYLETPSNPLMELADIQALADLAHAHAILLVVDNCFCTPALQRPFELGADLVIHSGTKYLDGQGRCVGGAVVGDAQRVGKDIFGFLRTAGPSLSPFNAWVFLKGLETLHLRMRAHSAAALQLAQWLETQPAVERVYYPGLPSHPQHELAKRQQRGFGGIVSFEVRGGREAAWALIDATRLISVTANLGDAKSTITHPATTTHGRLTPQERERAGIRESLVRISVGLEEVADLQTDLERGLRRLA